MAQTSAQERAERQLLESFERYDQYVDIVSAFEWLFTDVRVKQVPEYVLHFERFPRAKNPSGDELTPDFTAAFKSGNGLVGEIATIAIHENSVDKLCKQILRYDSLTSLPDGSGGRIRCTCDVILLVPFSVGAAAAQRILVDRMANADDSYKPTRAPIIVQYAREGEAYVFQRYSDPANGVLVETGREPPILPRLNIGLKIRAAQFVAIKAARAFINDGTDPLYLSTHLWTKTWPTQHGAPRRDPIKVNPASTANLLRRQHGRGSAGEVRAALELLAQAGLAAQQAKSGSWEVAWARLTRQGDSDIHKIIARRACGGTPTRSRRLATRTPSAYEQGSLF
ncbi:hypothetical protein Drose_36760 [Dactylosporangium roseum]|uniref:Uncharacterized protein n=1 Tax=Dactylosporangium roseum TaxID=47989 RepID=A0ABY5Z3B2_9ACTN|nr:hypothetical protein [Dactylosporangium roseum]UWZ36506.1 hypothetical protein Drose_36760 [Dactylosporangium roseum]